ncbi:RNA polymerase sigma factor (sigma-70 family) [Scopulibacillus daqui]|uniref:RNA polymerase sigma factor (Sigma-70 family) n=1 Tax=Scopulibacillus daqui TaxID=1469162 RepID=A0ABS2PY92_9BACL|nr:RNA polymerase sigma factor [Scopulibacillus daqui]MBM7644921.1 RNA polymerase sigma factor (sigma-70 family) [Scopulibacillus daqui]
MQASVSDTSSIIDDADFEKAIKPYFHQLKSYCLSLAKSSWDGEDLFQDTLIKAFSKWKSHNRNISKAYLFKAASNAWIDRHRKRQPDIDDSAELTNISLNESEDKAAVEEAMGILLKKLTPKQRAVLLLIEGFNFTHKEVAEMIGSKEGAVRAVLHRAHKKLQLIDKKKDIYSASNEEDVRTYVQTFYSGSPERFAALYKQEAGIVNSMASHSQFSSRLIKGVGSGRSVYYLVPIILNNGKTLVMPFYQAEINVLLSWIEAYRSHLQKSALLLAA